MTWASENPRDVSLYFHIPFCSKKCDYCHFFVLPDKQPLKEQFLFALATEWKMRLPQLDGKRIVSIYFGGGTPSRLDPIHLQTILDTIFASGLDIAADCEITIEANPEDATLPLMRQYHSMGINRISLGIQSLDDSQLGILSRQHSAQKGISAILQAYEAGIENISIDLMYDLPHQSLESWQRTLQRLQALPITHLSLYNLTFEPHTVFFKRKKELTPHLPTQEQSLELLQGAILAIEALGLKRYEISAFARPEKQSRHNTGYWTGRPFLGFGPSAFSYWEGRRFSNVSNLSRYSQSLIDGAFPIDFEEQLSYPQNLTELFAVRIRLNEGVDLKQFEKCHGALPEGYASILQRLLEKGWTRQNEGVYALTEEGMLFYDSVAAELI